MLYNALFFVCFKGPILYLFGDQIMHLTPESSGAALLLTAKTGNKWHKQANELLALCLQPLKQI